MNARSEFTNRRSPGVLSLMKSFDGRVIETGWRFQIAVPALNQPPLRPTRGSGEGGVVDMSGAPESATPFIDELRAQAARASAPSASEAYDNLDFMTDGRGEGWGTGTCLPRAVAQHQAHAFDLGRLVGVDVGRESEDVQLLAR